MTGGGGGSSALTGTPTALKTVPHWLSPVTYIAGHLHLQQHLQVLFARALRPLLPLLLLRFGTHAVQENEKLAPSAQHARRRPASEGGAAKKARRKRSKQANKQKKRERGTRIFLNPSPPGGVQTRPEDLDARRSRKGRIRASYRRNCPRPERRV